MWSYDKETGLIRMTKGDTPVFKIECNIIDNDGKLVPYQPLETDEIVFALTQNKGDSELLTIYADLETMSIIFKEEDTKFLDLGKYWYEISLNSGDYHCTFVEGKRLILTHEIY